MAHWSVTKKHMHSDEQIDQPTEEHCAKQIEIAGCDGNRCRTFCTYDDATRRPLYSNCGDNPPSPLARRWNNRAAHRHCYCSRPCEEWQCLTQETPLHPGDVLAIYSDGVTEAMNGADEEFGELCFIAGLRESRSSTLALLLTNRNASHGFIRNVLKETSFPCPYSTFCLIISPRLPARISSRPLATPARVRRVSSVTT